MSNDRNDDRYWYDKGYSLGVTETQRDAVWGRLIGAWSLFAGALWDPLVAGTFLALYTLFEVSWWRRRCDKAEHKREFYDPGPTWEWQREHREGDDDD